MEDDDGIGGGDWEYGGFFTNILTSLTNLYENGFLDDFNTFPWENPTADPTNEDWFQDMVSPWLSNGEDLNGDGVVNLRDAAISWQQEADKADEALDDGAGLPALWGRDAAEAIGGAFGTIQDMFDWMSQ